MYNSVSLKKWSDGTTPNANDLLSWSNFIFERSLQVKNVEDDAVSKYFFTQWMAAEKEPTLLANIFERVFSAYGIKFQVQLLNALTNDKIIQPIELLNNVKGNGELHRYLLTRLDVWKAMELHQLLDNIYNQFDTIAEFGKDYPEKTHPVWDTLQSFKTPSERSHIFETAFAPKIRHGFFRVNDRQCVLDVKEFHPIVQKISNSWNVYPAQLVYCLLYNLPNAINNYRAVIPEGYYDCIEPYTNDIRELIQFSMRPNDDALRKKLPDSIKPTTVDPIFALIISSNPENILMDKDNKFLTEYDPEAAAVLGAAF